MKWLANSNDVFEVNLFWVAPRFVCLVSGNIRLLSRDRLWL